MFAFLLLAHRSGLLASECSDACFIGPAGRSKPFHCPTVPSVGMVVHSFALSAMGVIQSTQGRNWSFLDVTLVRAPGSFFASESRESPTGRESPKENMAMPLGGCCGVWGSPVGISSRERTQIRNLSDFWSSTNRLSKMGFHLS